MQIFPLKKITTEEKVEKARDLFAKSAQKKTTTEYQCF